MRGQEHIYIFEGELTYFFQLKFPIQKIFPKIAMLSSLSKYKLLIYCNDQQLQVI